MTQVAEQIVTAAEHVVPTLWDRITRAAGEAIAKNPTAAMVVGGVTIIAASVPLVCMISSSARGFVTETWTLTHQKVGNIFERPSNTPIEVALVDIDPAITQALQKAITDSIERERQWYAGIAPTQ